MLRTSCEDFRSPCIFTAVCLGLELICLPECTQRCAQGVTDGEAEDPVTANVCLWAVSLPAPSTMVIKCLRAAGVLGVALVHLLRPAEPPAHLPLLLHTGARCLHPLLPGTPGKVAGGIVSSCSLKYSLPTPPELQAREGLPSIYCLLLSLPPGTCSPGPTFGGQ